MARCGLLVLTAWMAVGCGADSSADSGGSGGEKDGDGPPGGSAACGPLVDGPDPGDPACGGIEAALVENPATEEQSLINRAIQADYARLHVVVGQYACGDAPVYVGQTAASDNSGEVFVGGESGLMRGESVIASLLSGDGLAGFDVLAEGAHLFVQSPDEGLRMLFRQATETPGVTDVSTVRVVGQSLGPSASCDSCLPDLSELPDDISFDLEAAGGDLGAALLVRAAGTLTRVAATELRWADIDAVNAVREQRTAEIPAEFEPCGNLVTRAFTNRYTEGAPSPPGSSRPEGTCVRSVSYSARWWVDTTTLARHGVHDFEGEARYCCGGGETGSPECFPLD